MNFLQRLAFYLSGRSRDPRVEAERRRIEQERAILKASQQALPGPLSETDGRERDDGDHA